MAITIQVEKVTQNIPITIKTPHYYKHNIDTEDGSQYVTIFGKIMDHYMVSLTKSVRVEGDIPLEIHYGIERIDNPNFNTCRAYLTDTKYASNKGEFDEALSEMKKFLKNI